MKRDMVVFGEDWGGLPSSTQHLILHLAKERKILWVNSIGLRSPQFNFKDILRMWTKLTAKSVGSKSAKLVNSHSPQKENIPENITVIHPKTLPAPRTKWARKMAASMLSRQLNPLIKAQKLERPILWTSLPTAVDVAQKLDISSLVYYCGDDFSSLAGVDHDTVTLREQTLVQKADLILTASDTLFQRLNTPRTQCLPHGVDHALFSSPAPRASDLPHNGRPTAGFYGSISDWLDYDLLEKTICLLPHWNFVFIGHSGEKASRIKALKNTFFLGPRPHYQLPMYCQHWNASLLPFLDNPQINACNPLKLLEYLASGRPLVSTPFPAIKKYKKYIHIAENAEEFAAALEKAQHLNVQKEQQNAVKIHTWQARAKILNEWLDAL